MRRPATNIPEKTPLEDRAPTSLKEELQANPARRSLIAFLSVVGLLLLIFTGFSVYSLPQVLASTGKGPNGQKILHATDADTPDQPPLTAPGEVNAPPLHLTNDAAIIYESQNGIYKIPVTGGKPQSLLTPGYVYSTSIKPVLTASGLLLYSGDGLWVTTLATDTPVQVAKLAAGQIITSMVLSDDSTLVAWSTEPLNGKGNTNLYLTSLAPATFAQTTLIYQQPANQCPCFRVFSFLEEPGVAAHSFLLLSDDRGDHDAVRSGLWILDLRELPADDPQQLLSEDAQQGPLLLMPHQPVLLYAPAEGVAPEPTDQSVPADLVNLNHATGLTIALLHGDLPTLTQNHTILPAQHELSNIAEYHWIATPLFSPDGHTLVYLEFSSDAQAPFDRHYAVYSVQVKMLHGKLQVGQPQLIATSLANFVTLGAWMNNNIITFYSSNALYAMDVQTGAMTIITKTAAYARIIDVVQGQI